MSLSDPIGDMLARLKNSQMRNHKKIEMPSSKFKTKIAEILKSEGYIIDYEVKSEQNKSNLHISLKYSSGNPVINSIERIMILVFKRSIDFLNNIYQTDKETSSNRNNSFSECLN